METLKPNKGRLHPAIFASSFTQLKGEGRRRFSPNLDWRLGLLFLLAALALCAWGMSEAKARMDRDYAEGQEMSR